MANMSSELLTPWLPGGDDFVDVSDTFLEAAQGEFGMRLERCINSVCHDRYGIGRCYID